MREASSCAWLPERCACNPIREKPAKRIHKEVERGIEDVVRLLRETECVLEYLPGDHARRKYADVEAGAEADEKSDQEYPYRKAPKEVHGHIEPLVAPVEVVLEGMRMKKSERSRKEERSREPGGAHIDAILAWAILWPHMPHEEAPGQAGSAKSVDEAFAALGTDKLIEEAHEAIAESETTRANAHAATTAHLDQAAQNLMPFAEALVDHEGDDDVLLLTDVVEEDEDQTK